MAYRNVILAASPVFVLPMDETTGNLTDLVDSKTATANGTPTYGLTGPVTGDTAIDFDASADYFSVADDPDLDTDSANEAYTIEIWAARDNDSGTYEVMAAKGTNGWNIGLNTTDYFFFGKAGVQQVATSDYAPPADGSWHHYVVTRIAAASQAGDTKIYVDGVLRTLTLEYYGVAPDPTTSPLIVGQETSGEPFPGKLAYLAIYKSVLTPAQIAAHYAARYAGDAYTTEVLADSPSAYWRLDEASGNFADEIGSLSLVPTDTGDVTYGVTGGVARNAAITLDGTTGGLDVGDTAALDLGDVFTIEFWLKRGNTAVVATLFEKGTGTDSGYGVWFNASDTLQFSDGAGNAFASYGSAVTDTTTWHHIVLTKNGATRAIYVDGVEGASLGTNRTLADNATALSIGSTGADGNRLNGSLDEVALYKTALSAARVAAHYAARNVNVYSTEILTDVPSAYYRLGEPSGDFVDTMGGFSGTAVGTITRDVAGFIADDDGAVSSDGSSGYISVSDEASLDLADGPLTLECWFKRDGAKTTYAGLIDKQLNAYFLHIKPSTHGTYPNQPCFGKTGAVTICAAPAMTDTGWHHLVVTYFGGTTGKFYVDGEPVTTTQGTTGTLADNTNQFWLMQDWGNAGFLNGTLDEVAVYKRVLSDARIAAHYAAALAAGGGVQAGWTFGTPVGGL